MGLEEIMRIWAKRYKESLESGSSPSTTKPKKKPKQTLMRIQSA